MDDAARDTQERGPRGQEPGLGTASGRESWDRFPRLMVLAHLSRCLLESAFFSQSVCLSRPEAEASEITPLPQMYSAWLPPAPPPQLTEGTTCLIASCPSWAALSPQFFQYSKHATFTPLTVPPPSLQFALNAGITSSRKPPLVPLPLHQGPLPHGPQPPSFRWFQQP